MSSETLLKQQSIGTKIVEGTISDTVADDDGNAMSLVVDPLKFPPPSLFSRISKALILPVITMIALPFLFYIAITKFDIFYETFSKATAEPSIQEAKENKDSEQLLVRLWQSRTGKLFKASLEYQKSEGYCCSATQRCLLKSIPGMDIQSLPEQKRAPATVQKFAQSIDEMSNGATTSSVILGSDGFESFLGAVKRVNDPNVRIALNFLRSPLFGVNKPVFLPFNWLLCFFGGHFSPVVGYFEDVNSVAVFDVNHKYSFFFVSPERLWQAVNTHDVSSGKARGIIVVEVVDK
mmetsp:Transcript_23827/g.34153  ORF Transcript_23827/g.34153 Transcript_23827/m.34153 type:complete len:292 (+) Transcript_23827:220-1095(+)